MHQSGRPTLAITAGDPAGVGPELIAALLTDQEFADAADLLIFADSQQLTRNVGTSLAKYRNVEVEEVRADDVRIGKITSRSGSAAITGLVAAVEAMNSGRADVLVTGPISKEGLKLAGADWPGQTEALADLTASPTVHVMLVGGKLRVVHLTTHKSLRRALDGITEEAVVEAVEAAATGCRHLGVHNPRIIVAGLNPHAGENGLLGDEEIKVIAPAIGDARRRGLNVEGPVSPDTVFLYALAGDADAVVAMYHDQGHIAVKLLAADDAVTMTLGLPFIRTSPDHGAAPAIAGTGAVRTSSFLNAVRTAITCSAHAKNLPQRSRVGR